MSCLWGNDKPMKTSESHSKDLQSQRFEALYRLSQMDTGDLSAIKNFALESAVQTTRSQIGYIYFMNEDETVLTLHAWSKSVMPECRVADPETEYQVVHTGLWGEALRQLKLSISNDIVKKHGAILIAVTRNIYVRV